MTTKPLANDVFRQGARPLDKLFRPRAVAVIGASETAGSVGRTLMWNLLATPFGGAVYAVNPNRTSVCGLPAYRSVADVAAPIDLAVIATPAPTVPGVVRECVARGVPAGIVISAGFREAGPEGQLRERELVAEARRGGMRLIGPNCLGLMSPPSGLNATFAAGMARPGHIACLSQSGALLTAILDWSQREQVGFSALVSLGAMIDVGWSELIDHFGDDPQTRAIVLYMETIGDARAFLSAAREVALTKPIIVLKPGRSEAGSRAARSHTGALTGADDVLDAAFRRAGVLRVNDIAALFDLAEALDKQPRPRGPRLAIVTNAGGPGVLATDALLASGGELAPLDAETLSRLDDLLPAAWSHANPIDILGDADPGRYVGAVAVATADPASDGLLAILTPQDMTDPTAIATALAARGGAGKPVLASWMGGAQVAAGVDVLNRAGIPTFDFPDDAARTFAAMWRHADDLRGLYETPIAPSGASYRRDDADALIGAATRDGRTLLDEEESKRLLVAYGIPTVPTFVARDEEEAVAAAHVAGFPVAVKLWSRVVTHKRAAGGVKLGLRDPAAVAAAFREIAAAVKGSSGADAFLGVTVQPFIERDGETHLELIVGSAPDPQLGPVILFGAGGELVEVLRDRALALPPLTTTLARRLISETRLCRGLLATRGEGALPTGALADLLVRFADLVVSHPRIRELDINPLLVRGRRLLALDARVVLHDRAIADDALPRPAIRPYPIEHVARGALRDGTAVVVRPIRPDDEPLVAAFHGTLSDESVRSRYLYELPLAQRTAHTRLVRVCFADYDRELAFVVEQASDGATASGPREPRQVLAIGRLSRDRVRDADAAEFALLIGDRWQGRGVGRLLLAHLLDVARREGWRRVYADVLGSNLRMQRLCTSLGFRISEVPGDDVVTAEWTCTPTPPTLLAPSAPRTAPQPQEVS
jgi:acetyltransferase